MYFIPVNILTCYVLCNLMYVKVSARIKPCLAGRNGPQVTGFYVTSLFFVFLMLIQK